MTSMWKNVLRSLFVMAFIVWSLGESHFHTRADYNALMTSHYRAHETFWFSISGCVPPDYITCFLVLLLVVDSFWMAVFAKIYMHCRFHPERREWIGFGYEKLWNIPELVVQLFFFGLAVYAESMWKPYLEQLKQAKPKSNSAVKSWFDSSSWSMATQFQLTVAMIFIMPVIHAAMKEPFRSMEWHQEYPGLAHYLHYDLFSNSSECRMWFT